jgi:hypothetical protein
MVDVVYILVGVVALLMMFVANLYILVYYQHEEDAGSQALGPKVVVVSCRHLPGARSLRFPRGGPSSIIYEPLPLLAP